MKPETIRWIDVNIGRLMCWGLSVWRNLGKLIGGGRKTTTPEKILFIKFIEQGATVLAYSAIEEAVRKVGRENTYFVVFEENAPVVDVLDMFPPENVFIIKQDNFRVFLGQMLKTMLRIRRIKIDTTVDMEFFSRASAIFAYLAGARNRVGLHRFRSEQPYRGNLMTHRVQFNPYHHTALSYRLLVEALYEPVHETPILKTPAAGFELKAPKFKPTAEETKRVSDLLKSEAQGSSYDRVVLLNPNASDMLPLRKWPTDRFVDLAHRILKAYPETLIVLTGAPAEQPKAEEIVAEVGSSRLVSVAGKTSMRDLFVLYTLSDLLVTNDSGPAHFASTSDIHIVVLFGPETPELFGPLGPNVTVLWKKLACSPCVNATNHRFSACTNNLCMQTITVDEVEEAVHGVMTKNQESPVA